MTFNEGVQIDTSTTSTSGSGGGRRLAIGGGLGGLLVVVVAMLLGVDPGGRGCSGSAWSAAFARHNSTASPSTRCCANQR